MIIVLMRIMPPPPSPLVTNTTAPPYGLALNMTEKILPPNDLSFSKLKPFHLLEGGRTPWSVSCKMSINLNVNAYKQK